MGIFSRGKWTRKWGPSVIAVSTDNCIHRQLKADLFSVLDKFVEQAALLDDL